MPILQWLTREEDVRVVSQVPYKLLNEVPEYSFGDPSSENMLIQGDNLEALKALLPYYAGQVKCIFIDPPYNTQTAKKHYDDNVEHSVWLSIMYPRLQLLRDMMRQDGVIFISIDDDEGHYLKIICDEVFGRKNYIGSFIWEKKQHPSFLSNMGCVTDYILCYARSKSHSPNFCYGLTQAGKKTPLNNAGNTLADLEFPPKSVFFNMDDQIVPAQNMSEGKIIAELLEDVEIKDGYNVNPLKMRGEWRNNQAKIDKLLEEGETFYIAKIPFRINHIKSKSKPKKVKNLLSQDAGHYAMATNEIASEESVALFGTENSFDYPKPEKLLEFLISICTSEGDLVLDSFLGSGTTAAVAHKMHRRYIGIEMGEHAKHLCKLRLEKVVQGEKGGVSEALGWEGGGGFHFYELGANLHNEEGKINPDITHNQLAAHIWFTETYKPCHGLRKGSAFLGVDNKIAYVLIHKDVCGTDILTSLLYEKTLRPLIREADPEVEKIVIYAGSNRMSRMKQRAENIVFKQIPYEVKGR